MQEVKIICDRCGKEMKQSTDREEIRSWNRHASQYTEAEIKTYDLCPECKKAFQKWLKE